MRPNGWKVHVIERGDCRRDLQPAFGVSAMWGIYLVKGYLRRDAFLSSGADTSCADGLGADRRVADRQGANGLGPKNPKS